MLLDTLIASSTAIDTTAIHRICITKVRSAYLCIVAFLRALA